HVNRLEPLVDAPHGRLSMLVVDAIGASDIARRRRDNRIAPAKRSDANEIFPNAIDDRASVDRLRIRVRDLGRNGRHPARRDATREIVRVADSEEADVGLRKMYPVPLGQSRTADTKIHHEYAVRS